jgi:hypothetical protein
MTPRSCSYFDRISDTSNMVPEQHATRPRYFHQPTGNFDRAPKRCLSFGRLRHCCNTVRVRCSLH